MSFATWKIKEKFFAFVYYTLTEFEWTMVWPLLPLIQAPNFPLQRVTQEFCCQPWKRVSSDLLTRAIKLRTTSPRGAEGDSFSAEHQPVFSQGHKDSGHAFTSSANLNKSWRFTQAVINQMHTETSWRHRRCGPQASRYFGCCPEQVVNNCKKLFVKIQTPLFLTSLQEPS